MTVEALAEFGSVGATLSRIGSRAGVSPGLVAHDFGDKDALLDAFRGQVLHTPGLKRVQAGACWINAFNLTPIELPFGGMKQSGLGRENGRAAIEHHTQLKSVYVALSDIAAPY